MNSDFGRMKKKKLSCCAYFSQLRHELFFMEDAVQICKNKNWRYVRRTWHQSLRSTPSLNTSNQIQQLRVR